MTPFYGSLDANVLLRLLLNDVSEQHQAALALFESTSHQFALADTAIIEIVFVLERHYAFTRSQIADAIEGLMSLPQVNCNRTLFEQALILFAERNNLSFEDCCLTVYAELNQAQPLWTFDQKLAQVPGVKLVPVN
jgi:predicted nucleic-acid-binding protein